MMMNAGRSFWHEESAPVDPVEMLQIFIRPREADLPGHVQFYDRKGNTIEGDWHLIAAPEDSAAPLKIRQHVMVFDARLPAGTTIDIARSDGMEPSLGDVSTTPNNVRFTLANRHRRPRARGPKSANNRLVHRNKQRRYSIT